MKLNTFNSGIPPRTGGILLVVLLLIATFHYFVYNYQNVMLSKRIDSIKVSYLNSSWKDIEGVIDLATAEAKLTAKTTADEIVHQISLEYPDKSILRAEFDAGIYNSPKFTSLILNSIKNKYLFDIHNRNNDIFVIGKNGIIADMNTTKLNRVGRPFTEEASSHYNPELAFRSLEAILLREGDNSIIYYEPHVPVNGDNHPMITSPTKDKLKEVYRKEGLDGLKGYVVLVPVYITDDGDIFGNMDIAPDGSVNMTHKLIVVQRFSIYDIITDKFNLQRDVKEEMLDDMVQDLTDVKNFQTFAFTCIIILNMMVILILFKVISRDKPEGL